MSKQEFVTAYYDGSCPLCQHEMDLYKKKDVHDRLKLVDISSSDFNPEADGLDKETVNKYFHLKNLDGEMVAGVEAFLCIWKALDIFPYGVVLAENRLSRSVMNFGYIVFANLRPYLPKKKCDTNCSMRP